MVEAFEDYAQKSEVIGTVALLSGGESARAAADEVPRIFV